MSNHVIAETARSQIEAELSKLRQLHARGLPETLLNICKELTAYLERELTNAKWEDRHDIQELCINLKVISDIAGLFSAAAKDRSSWWAEALVKEFYERLTLSLEEREIILVHSDEVTDFMVYPNVLDVLRKRMGIKLPKRVDVFWIPLEARHDLSSISLASHEVGHVYFQERKQQLLQQIDIDSNQIQFDLFEDIDARVNKITSHVEEYFCDAIGRHLMGPAFDIALIKLLLPYAIGGKGSDTHPPEARRIHISFSNLQAATQKVDAVAKKDLATALKRITEGWFNVIDTVPKEISNSDDEYAISLSEEILNQSNLPSSLLTPNLDEIWSMVVPELSSFRPPIERVDKNRPHAISAIQAVIGTALYYYGEHFRQQGGNDYFEHANKQSEIERFAILRQRLIEHLIYAVSLCEFVRKAQSKLKETDFSDDKLGKSPLWQMRVAKTGGRPNPLVIIPSIDPVQQYGDNAVDLRLGSCFLIHQPSRYTHLEPNPRKPGSEQDYFASVGSFYTELNIPMGKEFILHPHQFVLAGILEYICLPFNYYALVLGRSTWGRLGLNIATATTVQAGYRGCLTLELRNLGETPLPLTVGTRIAQLCVIKVPSEGTEKGYFVAGSKYVGPVKPEVPFINLDKDWELLTSIMDG